MKTWRSSQWRNERAKLIDNQVCSQCGSTLDLQIHHHYSDSKLYNLMKKRVVNEMIHEKMDSGEFPFQGLEFAQITCPHCSTQIKITRSRLEQSQYMKCTICQKRILFKDQVLTNIIYIKEPNYHLKRTDLNIFLHKFQNEITQRLKEKNAPMPFDYLNLSQDTVVLCKTCHYALENRHNLCPICRKNYKPINQKYCFECLSDEEKSQLMQNH